MLQHRLQMIGYVHPLDLIVEIGKEEDPKIVDKKQMRLRARSDWRRRKQFPDSPQRPTDNRYRDVLRFV